jgi:site-specific DNA recombinase
MKYFVYCRKSTDAEDRQVLSLESQLSETNKLVEGLAGARIVHVYQEARSAKTPGRPVFDEMIKRIEKGEAHGVISWHPDRLARNALDGARVIHLLDTGKLKDLRFATGSFENNPQGKLMLSMLFGFSKYYVDSLAENIRRGNRTKAEKGWRPTKPPLGYMTAPVTKTTIPDPERFELIREIFRLMLTGAYTPRRILGIATNEWGLRTRKRPKGGDCFLHLSSIYSILGNPFYAGIFKWDGEMHAGKHPPMVTLEEFERVQTILRRPNKPRPIHRDFAYTGMIRCGICGLAVTAEEKQNRYGYHYTYYHCTRRKRDSYCREKCIALSKLEEQIVNFLETLRIATMTRDWLALAFPTRDMHGDVQKKAQLRSLDESISHLDKQIATLTGLRLRDLIDDDEFSHQREDLTGRRLALIQKKQSLQQEADWIEPFEMFVSFCNKAVECFFRGDLVQKRLILETVGSNLILADRKLSIEARKPFVQMGGTPSNSELCSVAYDVRTFLEQGDASFAQIMENIRIILAASGSDQRGA